MIGEWSQVIVQQNPTGEVFWVPVLPSASMTLIVMTDRSAAIGDVDSDVFLLYVSELKQ